MVSFNIKSDIDRNLDQRPLKRSKCSEPIDSGLDKDVNENAPSPPSPSMQVSNTNNPLSLQPNNSPLHHVQSLADDVFNPLFVTFFPMVFA